MSTCSLYKFLKSRGSPQTNIVVACLAHMGSFIIELHVSFFFSTFVFGYGGELLKLRRLTKTKAHPHRNMHLKLQRSEVWICFTLLLCTAANIRLLLTDQKRVQLLLKRWFRQIDIQHSHVLTDDDGRGSFTLSSTGFPRAHLFRGAKSSTQHEQLDARRNTPGAGRE